MKRFLFAAALAAMAAPGFGADLGVSVSIGQPGFFGRLDIGGYPPPQLLYRQPVLIERGAGGRPPVYLHVPPGHAKNWRKHCREYNACGERVYFVQENWYNREYVPRYQERQHGGLRDGRGIQHRNAPQAQPRNGPYDGRGNEHHEMRGNERPGEDRGHNR